MGFVVFTITATVIFDFHCPWCSDTSSLSTRPIASGESREAIDVLNSTIDSGETASHCNQTTTIAICRFLAGVSVDFAQERKRLGQARAELEGGKQGENELWEDLHLVCCVL